MNNSWDDIIYEHRNKGYGGYRLRKDYNRVMLLSLVAGCLIFLSPFLYWSYKYRLGTYYRAGTVGKVAVYEMNNYSELRDLDELAGYTAQRLAETTQEHPTGKQNRTNWSTIVIDSVSSNPDNFPSTDLWEETGGEGGSDSTGSGIYVFVEIMPEFPGGEEGLHQFIVRNIRYPDYALKNNIRGTVYASFVINENGAVEDVQITKGVHPVLDDEVIRIIRLFPRWQPGLQHGKKVKVRYLLPVDFL